MYKVVLSKTAVQDLNKINKKYKPHIFAALFNLKIEPFLGKKLKGKLQEYYSLRVGVYRIIYKVYKKNLGILVIRINHRQGVYR